MPDMANNTKLLLWVLLLGLIDAIVPFFPVLALILVYVVIDRPGWFLDSVKELYGVS